MKAGPFGRRAGTEQAANGLQRILKRPRSLRSGQVSRIVGYHPINPFENPLEIGPLTTCAR